MGDRRAEVSAFVASCAPCSASRPHQWSLGPGVGGVRQGGDMAGVAEVWDRLASGLAPRAGEV
eukprot:306707-Chlamydomonas_euryale.AAC.2